MQRHATLPVIPIAEVCERTFFENCPRLGPLYSRLVERPMTSNPEAGSLLLLYRCLEDHRRHRRSRGDCQHPHSSGLAYPGSAALTGAAAGSVPSGLIPQPRPDSTGPTAERTSPLGLRSREQRYAVDIGLLSSMHGPKNPRKTAGSPQVRTQDSPKTGAADRSPVRR